MVINYSDQDVRRVELLINASYDDEPDKVINALKKAAEQTENVLSDPATVVFVSNYGDNGIDYQIFAYTPNSKFLDTKYALMRQIFYTFRENGVTMTYDHLNLHIVEDRTKEEK